MQPVRRAKTPRRNEPCPCGSGKKAKRCCLPNIHRLAALPPIVRTQAIVAQILGHPILHNPDRRLPRNAIHRPVHAPGAGRLPAGTAAVPPADHCANTSSTPSADHRARAGTDHRARDS